MSKHDYDDYQRLKGLATRPIWVSELSDDAIAALVDARVDPRHDHLDALMDDETR
jgi:hypothetical protein